MKRYSITISCLLFAAAAFSQTQLTFKEKIKQAPTQRKVVDVISDNSGESLRVFEETMAPKKITKGPYAGLELNPSRHGLITNSGREFILPDAQQIVHSTDGQLIAQTSNYEQGTSSLISYQFSANGLKKLGERRMPSNEYSANLLENGLIFIADASEGYGTYAEIYSGNFQLLTTYKPFEPGFEKVLVSSHDTKIVAVFKSARNEVKMAVFNSVNGKLLNEGILNTQYEFQLMQYFNNQIIIYSAGVVNCFDISGNQLWSQQANLPSLKLYNDDKEGIYLFTDSELLALDAKNGLMRWRKNLSDLHSGVLQNPSQQTFHVVDMEVTGEFLSVVFSVSRKGLLTPTDLKSKSELVLLSKSGELLQKIALPSDATSILAMKKTSKGLQIIQDSQILNYEK